MWAACNGGYISEEQTRKRLHAEAVVVRALVEIAERCGGEERAAILPVEARDDEAARIAHDHGFDTSRLIALRGLANSRGVGLEVVLRAALRGELRSVVERPPGKVTNSSADTERRQMRKS